MRNQFQPGLFAKNKFKIFLVIIILSQIIGPQSFAQSFQLNPNFGTNGLTQIPTGSGTPLLHALKKLPNGKYLVGGQRSTGVGEFIVMSQVNEDGSIDASNFGNNGVVITNFLLKDELDAFDITADGKIICTGSQWPSTAGSSRSASVYRFNQNGTIDTSFGTGGYQVISFNNSTAEFFGVKILADGKILAVGASNASAAGGTNGFGAMRFLSEGILDSSFGQNGKSVLPETVGFLWVSSDFTNDGGILFATPYFNFPNNRDEFLICKFDSLGTPDSVFNGFPVLKPSIRINGSSGKIAIKSLPDGKFIVGAGTLLGGTQQFFTAFKFLADGTPDTTFGNNGRADIDAGSSNPLYDMDVDNAGNIIMVGGFVTTVITRFTAAGEIDTSFSPTGKIQTTLFQNATGMKILALSDQSIIIGGSDFGANFFLANFISNSLVPVELTSFSASAISNSVELKWQTATELNNLGFEIERSNQFEGWRKIAFISGNGTSTIVNNYSFVDEIITPAGKYLYRLKQIDIDGAFEYSNVVEVDFSLPVKYELSQNYPNPFNPSTKIRYSIPDVQGDAKNIVTLKIYDIIGNEVATLVNQEQNPGFYEVDFNTSSSAGGLSSGLYLYKLQAGSFVEAKKMMLLK